MTDTLDDILDDPFHGEAWAAYVELAIITGGPPDSETTRRLAYRYYEAALAERNRRRGSEINSREQHQHSLECQIVRSRIWLANPTKPLPAKRVFDRIMAKATERLTAWNGPISE